MKYSTLNLNKAFILLLLLIVSCTGMIDTVYAQVNGPQEIKWLRLSSLRQWFSNSGVEIEYGRRGRGFLQDQSDGNKWPAEFQFTDHSVAKGLWIGSTNYDDPISGERYAHKVIGGGTREIHLLSEFMPVDFRLIGRDNAPLVVVDGITGTDNAINDVVDDTDGDLKPDRMLINVVNTSMGITMTRKVLAFSQQYHENYYIYDFVFKNTGIIDTDGTKVEKTLTDVIFFFQYRYSIGYEAFRRGWSAAGNVSWGRNAVNQVVGQNPNDPNFEFRAQYSWYGPHSQSQGGLEGDWGAPRYDRENVLGAVQYIGTVTLHADKSPTDKLDDLFQPTTTLRMGSDQDAQAAGGAGGQFNASNMTERYEYMSFGHPAVTHADEIGNSFADLYGTDPGGYSQGQGFGPYTLAPGDSIHIVLAEAVAGISRAKNLEVGKNWFNNSAPFTLPDGSTTNDRDAYKKAWVQSGEDSLFQTFRRALANFNSGYNIPQPPPAPKTFEVRSGGDRILLSWSNEAESYPNFDGYKIYQAIGQPDTLYEEIFSCDRSNVVNEYAFIQAQRGFDYYFYIVSKDDGSTNDIEPGEPLVSNKFFTMTNQPAYLRRPAAQSLDEFVVVPNPFDTRSRTIQFGENALDRIAFFGLPPECTIKIYTESGELIHTIEHIDGSGDELWDSFTSSRQIVVSGLYIVVLETPDGRKAMRKFIIIR